MNAAGGICCHIHDLLRYGAYHLGDGSPLLRPESLAEMQKRQTPSLPYMGHCGLAWMISGEAASDAPLAYGRHQWAERHFDPGAGT